MATQPDPNEVGRSLEVFTDPNTYGPFDSSLVVCIDPRDVRTDGRLPVAVQTGGAGVGNGLDTSLALTADNGEGLVTIHDGIKTAASESDLTQGAHRDTCKFIVGRVAVTDEMARPSEATRHTVGRLSRIYGLGDELDRYVNRIQEAGRRMLGHLEETSPDDILDTVAGLYSGDKHVLGMEGVSSPAFYVLNHHPYLGLDRNLVHRSPVPLTAQAYHDSVAATHNIIMADGPGETRSLRAAAHLSRVAATLTVLLDGHDEIQILDAFPTPEGGIQVTPYN